MTATMLVLEPIFEAAFHSNSTRTVLGATPNRRWSRWKSCCRGHPVATQIADTARLEAGSILDTPLLSDTSLFSDLSGAIAPKG